MKMAIIGGGITGLAAAFTLEQEDASAKVTLFEKNRRLGGKLMTDHASSLVLERGADSFLSRKLRGIGLCEELGIADQLIGRRPENRRTFVKRHGQLHPLPEGLSGFVPTNLEALVDHPLLSPAGLARMRREAAVLAFEGTDDESLAAFVTRRMGHEVFENIVEPLMSGIFAGDAEKLSLLATYPHLREVEQRYGSLLEGLSAPARNTAVERYPPFVSFAGGMSVLIEALVAALNRTTIKTDTAVQKMARGQTGWWVQTDRGLSEFDAVLFTTPAYVSGRFFEEVDPQVASMLRRFPFSSTAVVNLAFPKKKLAKTPQSYGYIVPKVEESDILACTFSSQKWVDRAPEETLLLRVFMGRAGRSDILRYDDETLIMKAVDEIRETLHVRTAPLFHRVYRWPRGMPQYTLGHLKRIESLRHKLSQYPGVQMAGALFDGVGIPNCIASGESAAKAILKDRLLTLINAT